MYIYTEYRLFETPARHGHLVRQLLAAFLSNSDFSGPHGVLAMAVVLQEDLHHVVMILWVFVALHDVVAVAVCKEFAALSS